MPIEDETLESLLEASRTPQGRSRLTASGIVTTVLYHLSSSSSSSSSPLLSQLRLLRNLCAGEISNQDSFLSSGGADAVAGVLLGPPPATVEVIRAGLQLLGNVALAGEAHRSAVWVRLFPDGFLEMARVRERGVCDPLCMVLDTCCSSDGGRRRLEELCATNKGMCILAEIITTASQGGHHEEWLEWLLFKVCVEVPNFSTLYMELGAVYDMDSSDDSELKCAIFNTKHAFLLGILSKCLSERPKEVIVSNTFALNILNVVKKACEMVDFTSRGCSALPTCSPEIDALGYSLLILRDICAWDHTTSPAMEAPVDSLLCAGLLELVLTFLHELEPPAIVRKSMVREEELTDPSVARDSKVCPYKGYRRDVVSIIGNCLHRRKRVQDKVRQQNGIPLLLQQCVLDEDNPFLREWGLVAVRNLLEGNVDNQNEVVALELQEPVVTPEIARLGLRVEVDKETQRVKLVNIS